jgi:hypothetical protein
VSGDRWPGEVLLPWCVATALLAACDGGERTIAWERADGGDAGSGQRDRYGAWYGGPSYYSRWPHGPPDDPAFFPVSVWMQSPANAARFREVGINLFLGLWEGPTEEQLTGLGAAGMPTFCDQAGVWEAHLDDATIMSWMQPAEPDNAQQLPDGSYGPCVDPESVVTRYGQMVTRDPTRPVFLLFGHGAAVDDYIGRGTCSGRTDMYPSYAAGGDLLGFAIYPVNEGLPLDTIAQGVDHLRLWSDDAKPVFALIEASDFTGVVRPTPAQLRAQVWMALIHGAAGIGYHCHALEPNFSETDCIDDVSTAAALADVNTQIRDLAPALNRPPVSNGVTTASSTPSVPIDTRLTRYGGATYLFAVARGEAGSTATFTLHDFPPSASGEVIGEAREVTVTDGVLSDDFAGYAVHLYRIDATPAP